VVYGISDGRVHDKWLCQDNSCTSFESVDLEDELPVAHLFKLRKI
jgi:hypothetical protein